jgi:hypothetical protein
MSRTRHTDKEKARIIREFEQHDGSAAAFCRPRPLTDGEFKLTLKPEALEMLLSGIDLKHGMQRAWYELPD